MLTHRRLSFVLKNNTMNNLKKNEKEIMFK